MKELIETHTLHLQMSSLADGGRDAVGGDAEV